MRKLMRKRILVLAAGIFPLQALLGFGANAIAWKWSFLATLFIVTALALMSWARRRASRPLWMLGAALLAVVAAKLFLNDLGNSGTVARIVSFIGVGLLMLLIGFLSPIPPRAAVETKESMP